MNEFKKLVRGATKVIGGVAGLVLLRAPFTNTGMELMGGSLVIGLLCFAGYQWAEPDDDGAD